MTKLQEASTAHPDELLSPENLRALTALVSTTDDAGRLHFAANAIRALYPSGGTEPRARTLQLARCAGLIAALVAAQEPEHPVRNDSDMGTQLANALNDLMASSSDAVALATASLNSPDRRARGPGGGKRCVAELYLLNLQTCSCCIEDVTRPELDDATAAAVGYAISAMVGLKAIHDWGPGRLPAAAALPLLGGQPAVGAAAMALVLPAPAPADMVATAERFLPVALDMPGHCLRQGWRLSDPNAPTAIGVFSTPSVALRFLLECGLDSDNPSTVDALISRVPDLPRAVSAALQVAAASVGILPHPLGPLATAAARRAAGRGLRPGDPADKLRAALLLLSRLLNGEELLPLAAALDVCDAAWPVAEAAEARHPDTGVREAAMYVTCNIACHTVGRMAIGALISAAARLGIEGAEQLHATAVTFRDCAYLDDLGLGGLVSVMERLAEAGAGSLAGDEEWLAGVCEDWGQPDWEGLAGWAAARRRRRELERAGVEGGNADEATAGGGGGSSSGSSRGRDSGGGELAARSGDGEEAASRGGGLQAATDSAGGSGSGCTVQQPASGDGSQQQQQPTGDCSDQQQGSRTGKVCAVCGAAAAPGGGVLKKCSGCMAVLYCSAACQTQDWKQAGGHRATCKQLQAQRTAAPAAQNGANA
ncbi:hypothetical protein MNEG_4044 [Monoraphidium neglectum]|uniref:MYND-type domain-containing protein n=1 Tax=Monoraphidium neglectum TaxID=145388 RepID=A0A0D2NFL0_9CHLO|nr:hypothetical protein MNEG_4044 [Monoraphidium neglectum]KIZ03916.1 hypothetical protein MNEG_4044 [Monoraphidium neglectum]|eukprot:XP_013902935.1 hypothetical protein MNEG_4044 [Monoraphidium neglectum]